MTMKPKAERYRLKPAVQPTQTRQPQTAQPPEATSAPTSDTYTARQLRMARRVAERHGLEFETDLEAIAILNKKGIDPFDRGHVLGATDTAPSGPQDIIQLPQKVESQQLPANIIEEQLKKIRGCARTRIGKNST